MAVAFADVVDCAEEEGLSCPPNIDDTGPHDDNAKRQSTAKVPCNIRFIDKFPPQEDGKEVQELDIWENSRLKKMSPVTIRESDDSLPLLEYGSPPESVKSP